MGMANKLIKSNQRVKEHGEVFTPDEIVDLMIQQPEIKDEVNSLTATFLEPAAGEGAFLVSLLNQKMKVAKKISDLQIDYDENVLLALMSLYGVELLEDNLELLVMNMIIAFKSEYERTVASKFSGKSTGAVIKSAKTIIMANMVQGNTLTKLNDKGEPLIFSEWKLIHPSRKNARRKIQRSEYTLEAILTGGESNSTVVPSVEPEEIDLLAGYFEDETGQESIDNFQKIQYLPSKITEVYKEEVR